jgi:N-acetylglucosamine-6-phosphate deacetylase
MALAASSNTEVDFFDTVIRKQHGKLSTPDGTLAGSCLTMIEAVKNAVSACQISLYESIYMASAAPAKLLNLSDLHGTIKAGTIANLLSVDDSCNIQQIWHHGHSVNKRRR